MTAIHLRIGSHHCSLGLPSGPGSLLEIEEFVRRYSRTSLENSVCRPSCYANTLIIVRQALPDHAPSLLLRAIALRLITTTLIQICRALFDAENVEKLRGKLHNRTRSGALFVLYSRPSTVAGMLRRAFDRGKYP